MKPSTVKVGLICTRGLPARYGAFEQAADQLVKYSENISKHSISFFVPCIPQVAEEPYAVDNVVRRGVARHESGAGTILYGLMSFFWCYSQGCRKFIFFGYALAPFFWLFSMMGCDLICNVDGIEWRRAKWSGFARKFLKFCEMCAAKSKARLIFDASAIGRYFQMHHNVIGNQIFYGTEELNFQKMI